MPEENSTRTYFFDTHVIVEVLRQNTNYKNYTKHSFVTSKLNLFEVYEILLKYYSQEIADNFLEEYYPFARDFNKQVIRKAVLFKKRWHSKLSMTDCIGHTIANKLGILFLTENIKFKGAENVEFIR